MLRHHNSKCPCFIIYKLHEMEVTGLVTVWCGDNMSTWCNGHYFTYYTSPGWVVITSVEQLVEWELLGETKVFGEILPHCNLHNHKTLWPDMGLNPGIRYRKSVTNLLSYCTDSSCSDRAEDLFAFSESHNFCDFVHMLIFWTAKRFGNFSVHKW